MIPSITVEPASNEKEFLENIFKPILSQNEILSITPIKPLEKLEIQEINSKDSSKSPK